MKTFTLRQLIEENIFPLKIRSLRRMVANWEAKKRNEYHGDDYLLAINVSTTDKGCQWVVEQEQIDNWLKRKAFKK